MFALFGGKQQITWPENKLTILCVGYSHVKRFGALIDSQAPADFLILRTFHEWTFLFLVEVQWQIHAICGPFRRSSKNIVHHALCTWVVILLAVGVMQLTMLWLVWLHFLPRFEFNSTFLILQWCDSIPSKRQETMILRRVVLANTTLKFQCQQVGFVYWRMKGFTNSREQIFR